MTQEAFSFVDFMTIIAPLFGLIYLWVYTVLNENKKRSTWIEKLHTYDAIPFYRQRLSSILDTLDVGLGSPSYSIKYIIHNLIFHHGISIFYVLILYILMWVINNSHIITSLDILPSQSTIQERLILIIIIFYPFILYKVLFHFVGLILYVILQFFMIVSDRMFNFLFILLFILSMYSLYFTFDELSKMSLTIQLLGYALWIIFFSIMFFRLIGSLLLDSNEDIINKKQISWGVLLKIVPYLLGLISILASFFLLFSLIFIKKKLSFDIQLVFLFLLLIPFLNAILDFISLTISRIFFRHISRGEPWYKIMLHLLLDFWLALLFLISLVYLLHYAIRYYNTFVSIELQVPITQMLHNALQNPFSIDNAWISFMVLSTLVPTVLHSIFALINFVLYLTKIGPWYANLIEKNKKYSSQRMLVAFLISAPIAFISFFVLYLVYLLSIKIIHFLF